MVLAQRIRFLFPEMIGKLVFLASRVHERVPRYLGLTPRGPVVRHFVLNVGRVQVEGCVYISKDVQDMLFFLIGSIRDGSKYLLPK